MAGTLVAASGYGQSAREIRGRLTGIPSGWVGAIVSIPYLRIGTLCAPSSATIWGLDSCKAVPGRPLPADSLDVLPMAIRIGTGGKRPSTGSSIVIALPASLVSPDGRHALVNAYARVPRRFGPAEHAFPPLTQYFDPSLRLLEIEFLSDILDDDREPGAGHEALIVLAVPHALKQAP